MKADVSAKQKAMAERYVACLRHTIQVNNSSLSVYC